MDIRQVNASFAVADQVTEADLPQLKAQGFGTLICNRPDGEVDGQPGAEMLAARARELGFDWHWIPISSGNFTPEAVMAFDQVLAATGQPVLAFCRSGTRSITLWALAQSSRHTSAELVAAAAQAGYDLSPMAPLFDARFKS
ncbi:TIGR01244 family sulfur transferase [Zobellella sp. DQSA1]|uniref:TIGR01244 family sulfur transferase n=1 Tax=Zobellella sp. DQSA1 TaxID=3342386 RepID=UPI0035C1ACA2